MKKFFVSLVALVCATLSFAQSPLLATLSHDGKVSTFYSSQALVRAHKAAANGDIITLSSGTFVAVNITKAVTIRGAGMEVDTVHNVLPTTITGKFNINIADSVSQNLTLEGIYHDSDILYINVKRPKFLKCRLKRVSYVSNPTMKDAQFIYCKIVKDFALTSKCSASVVSCVVNHPWCNDKYSANFEFRNSIIRGCDVASSNLNNCIFVGDSQYLNKSNNVYNCVCSGTDVFHYIEYPVNTNKKSTYEELFKSYRGGEISDTENFELTDAAKKKFLGDDGTEVGIYGGLLPFDATPSYPRITKCNVAAKSTADGKLSVDIEVKAAE